MVVKVTYKEMEEKIKKLDSEIVKRERDDDKLREAGENFSALAKQMGVGVCIMQEDTLKLMNRMMIEITGYQREEMMTMHFSNMTTPNEKEIVKKRARLRLAGEQTPPVYETKVLCKDLTTKDVEISAGVISYKGKAATMAVVRDITKRKQAERMLRDSEEQYRNLMEQSPNYIFITQGGRVVYVNKRCKELIRYEIEEVCSKDFDFFKIIAPESMNLAKSSFKMHMDGKDVEPGEYTLIRKDGKKIETLTSTKVTKYKNEPAVLGIVTDISKLKRAEESLNKAREELELQVEQRTTELRIANKELEIKSSNLEETNTALKVLLKKREEDKTELEEKVLRNMKQIVDPYLEKLKNSRMDEKQQIYIGILEENLKDIISSFSHRLSSTFFNLTPTELQVANLIKQGKTSKEIAGILNLSSRTIFFHRENIPIGTS